MKTDATDSQPPVPTTRRRFIATSTLAGVGLMLAPRTLNAQNAAVPTNRALANVPNVAVVGCGWQARVLLNSLSEIIHERTIPHRLVALCDIWPLQLNQVVRHGYSYHGHEIRSYAELEDLLAKEKSLDAVFIATPDFLHATQTTLCLKAGLHVYCETPMAHNGTDARAMVRTMRETGKLLQIGYQQRSNPNYRYAHEILRQQQNLLGRLVGAAAEHHRRYSFYLRMPKPPSADTIRRSGFEDIRQFLNWRWFKKYSIGPISGASAHQFDVFNQWLGRPNALFATGGTDHHAGRECLDNISSCLTYATPDGTVCANHLFHHATNAFTEDCETFFGTEGHLTLAERGFLSEAIPNEGRRPHWQTLARKKLLLLPSPETEKREREDAASSRSDLRDSFTRSYLFAALRGDMPPRFTLPSALRYKHFSRFHIDHVENFLRAVRGEEKLNCDGTVAFESEVPLYRINDAVAAEKTIHFTAEDFDPFRAN